MPITNTIPSHSFLGLSRFPLLSKISSQGWLYIGLLLVSLFLRLVWLDRLPVALTHDEVFYANQARALSISGTDQSGSWTPMSLTSAHPLFAEWPGVMMVPGFWVAPSMPLAAYRFSYAVLGAFMPVLLAIISWQLFQKRKLSLIVMCLAIVNPWMFQMSRHGFDIQFSLFFYLSGLALILSVKSWWRLLALPLFFVGFMQYQGGKVLLVPLVLATFGYLIARARKSVGVETFSGLAAMALILISSFAMVGWFWRNLQAQSAQSRTNDLVIFNSEFLAKQVDAQRMAAIQNPFNPFVFNKGTVLGLEMMTQFVRSFDLVQFFVKGEPLRNPTTVWTHGLFYFIDALLLGIGFIWVMVNPRWRAQGWFLLSLVVFGTLPQVLNNKDTWIYLRLGLIYPILVIFASLGFYFAWKFMRPKWFIQSALIGLYSASVLFFGYHYLFIAPVHATTDKYFVERVLASYIKRLPADQKVTVLADESRFVFEELVFYNQYLVSENIDVMRQAFTSLDFEIDNLRVDTDCFDPATVIDTLVIKDPSVAICSSDKGQVAGITTDFEKLTDYPAAVIRSPYSGENRFTIVNDLLCGKVAADTNKPLDWQTMQVEQLNNDDFCQAFIVKAVK